MSLYPSLEALTIGKEVEAQNKLAANLTSSPANDTSACISVNYARLASEFLGLDLSLVSYDEYGNPCYGGQHGVGVVAASEGSSIVLPNPGSIIRKDPIEVSRGVREITVTKNSKGYCGLQLRNQDSGLFVTYVEDNSPAAAAGLRFGDQVLKIDSKVAAGLYGKDAMNYIKKNCGKTVSIVIRDRPLERVVSLCKDSSGSVGIVIKDGAICAVVKDSSAARNGVLINSQMVEVNGINVMGLSDKKIRELIKVSGDCVKFTIIPSFYYEHLTKKLGRGLMKHMDRSEPMA